MLLADNLIADFEQNRIDVIHCYDVIVGTFFFSCCVRVVYTFMCIYILLH